MKNGEILSPGCYTAMATSFDEEGNIDYEGLRKNTEFQVNQKATGVLAVGTSGESPTLEPEDHISVVSTIASATKGRIHVLGGAGSNSTKEALWYTGKIAAIQHCSGALLVEPYYNGPSSLEIREEYFTPIIVEYSDVTLVDYPIPGRTGCLMSAADLIFLAIRFPNFKAVKEATGDWQTIAERMKLVRELAPAKFLVFSGDDDKTYDMMSDSDIRANGVVSVMSNIVPAAVQQMCQSIFQGNLKEAERIRKALSPLFGLVTVVSSRPVRILGRKDTLEVIDKFRNPVPVKTMMQGLGMPAGPCRQPLGKMTSAAVSKAREALKQVWEQNPWVLEPIEPFFKVDISARLADDGIWEKLAY